MRKNYTLKLKLKSLLEERGLTQKKLSELSGVRESTISDIVRGSRTLINFEHFEKLARALEISEITELIDFDE
ncbi:MAG: helix-turn-helix transcriptional regulator [Streptococcus sanguinis]|nr:helix-turn-helix transcriptional regulator [Streptococcus sanguinis]MBF1701388.1 helix-turn-helix transcriptional regulator [Streptococcus sanguinis]